MPRHYLPSSSAQTSAPTNVNSAEPRAEGEQAGIEPWQMERYRARYFGDKVLKSIMNVREVDGRRIHKAFLTLPSKKLFPDYYTEIKEPMSLSEIKFRLEYTPISSSWQPPLVGRSPKKRADGGWLYDETRSNEGYHTLEEVQRDLHLVWNNAKTYNDPESQIYHDAEQLQGLTFRELNLDFCRIRPDGNGGYVSDPEGPGVSEGSDGRSGINAEASSAAGPSKKRRLSKSGRSTETPVPAEQPDGVQKVLQANMKKLRELKSTDGSGSLALDFFDELPSRKDYPDYFKIIKHPICFADVQQKVKDGKYPAIAEWKKDLDLMCDNAMMYNIEDSVIYQDAALLKVHIAKYAAAATGNQSKEASPNPQPLRLKFHLGSAGQRPGAKEDKTKSQQVSTARSGSEAKFSAAATADDTKPHVAVGQPPLPNDRVTSAIVDSLGQYSEEDKASWIKTLTGPRVAALQRLVEEKDANRDSEGAKSPAKQGKAKSRQHSNAQEGPKSPNVAGAATITSLDISSSPAVLPPLPKDQVNFEIVKSLDRYSEEEKTTWASGLSRSNVAELQRLLAIKKAKHGNHIQQAPAGPSTLFKTGRAPTINLPSNAVLITIKTPARPLPNLPLVRFVKFSYNERPQNNPSGSENLTTLRLANTLGISSHAVQVKSSTTQLHISAFLEEGFHNLNPILVVGVPPSRLAPPNGEATSNPSGLTETEMQEEAPINQSLSYAPLTELVLRVDGIYVPGALLYLNDDVSKRPIGNKWTVYMDPQRATLSLDMLIQRPPEQIANGRDRVSESIKIWVGRQT